MTQDTFVLILAGGAGTRFWPASRKDRPKQLLPLSGGDALIVETAERVLPLVGAWDRILVATGAHLVDATRAALPNIPAENFLVEPTPRNTAPCIGWAAAAIRRRDPNAVVVVLPSDHHIANPEGFRATLNDAVLSARTGAITTIGIRPSHPETGFGYIEVGAEGATSAALSVVRFVEKPDRASAEQFLASGRFLWNAGMFVFRVSAMLEAVRAHLPALAESLDAIDAAAAKGTEWAALAELFPKMPSVSIDKGVIEHTKNLAVVPGDFGWSDVGSWHSAWELATKDEAGNTHLSDGVYVDAAGNHVVDLRSKRGDGQVVALVGVRDLVIVQTDDALLVVPRERAQDVRCVVDALKARGRGDRI